MPKELTQDTLEQLKKESDYAKRGTEPLDASPPDKADADITLDIKDHELGTESNSDQDLPKKDTSSEDEPKNTDQTKEDSVDDEEIKVQIEDIPKVLSDAGFDPEIFENKVIKAGGLTDEIIAELKEKIDHNTVDAYVKNFNKAVDTAKSKLEQDKDAKFKAIEEENKKVLEYNNFIFNAVQGEDKFNAMAKVLNEKADKTLVERINKKLRSQDKDLISEALEQAVSEYNKLTGRVAVKIEGDAGGIPTNINSFISKHEYQSIIKTDKYKNDPVYARNVDAQRKKSMASDSSKKLPGNFYGNRDGIIYAL